MDREIYKQKFMEADSSRMPISEFQKIINDSIYPAAGPQRGYNNLLIAIEECAELIESFGEYVSGKEKSKYGVYEELTDVHLAQYYVMNVLGIEEKDIKLNTKHMTELDVLVSLSKLQFSLAKYMRKAETLPWQEKNQMIHQITEDLSGVKQSLLFIQGYMMMTKEELFKSINVVMDRQKNRNELQDPLGLQIVERVTIMKSDGVQNIFTWLKAKCKEENTKVQIAEKEYEEAKRTYHFEDEKCLIDSAERNVEIAKARLNAFVEAKISTEKYMKKLRHKEKREPYS